MVDLANKPSRGAATAFILVTAFLDTMALGIVVPVLPLLIVDLTAKDASSGPWAGTMITIWAAMQFSCSPVLGALSDRYGRRPVILISTAGLASAWILMGLSASLWWLAAGRLLGGATSASLPAVYAYMADTTSMESRTRAYGHVGAAFAAGWIAGPALGGMLGEFGPRVPLWIAGALSAVSFGYGIFVLPESLPQTRRTPFNWRRANPLGAIALLWSHRALKRLAAIYFMLYFANYVFSSIFALYAHHRFGLTPFTIGFMLSCTALLDVTIKTVLLGPMARNLGDRRTMQIGLAAGAGGMLVMAFASSPASFSAALVFIGFWGLASPTIQAMMSRNVAANRQGQLQGANSSVSSAAGILAPLVFGWAYGLTGNWLPGLSFLIAAVALLAAWLNGFSRALAPEHS